MKGIKTILGVLAAASLLFSTSAFAQENANRDENGNVVRGAYETNKAFDNTFIGVGIGWNAGLNLADWPIHLNPFKITGVPLITGKGGLAVDVYAGKWWTPFIGGRLGWHGIQNDQQGNVISQNIIYGDLLWSATDTFGGYKETRIWDVIPYISTGLDLLNVNGQVKRNWVWGFGILNEFRLSSRVNLHVDFRAYSAKASDYEVNYVVASNNAIRKFFNKLANFHFPVSATIGVAFNLGKTNFNRHSSITPVVIPVPFTTDQYNALADKVAALEKENAELKDKIAALENEVAPLRNLVDGQTYLYENGKFTAIDVKPGSPITLYFDCGSATLSAREKAHFEYFADTCVDGDTKLLVNGYADKQTGSARRNQQLSEQRVKTVVDLLKKAGAKEENIESAAHGATVQLFDGAAKNRVVTIELK